MPQLDRRSVIRSAAWSVPVITVATAAPAFAVSSSDVGAYTLTGTCGVLGVQPPGFVLMASSTSDLPVGTVVNISASGIANAGTWTTTGGSATVTVVNATTRQITLTAPLPAGGALDMRTTLSITTAWTLNASTVLPSGYTSTGGKASASITSTLVLCSVT
jgi:hypothetical protein